MKVWHRSRRPDRPAFPPGVGVRDADSSNGGPPGGGGDEVGVVVRGDVLAQPAAGLVQVGTADLRKVCE